MLECLIDNILVLLLYSNWMNKPRIADGCTIRFNAKSEVPYFFRATLHQRWKWVIFRDAWDIWRITQLTRDPHDPLPRAITLFHPTHGTMVAWWYRQPSCRSWQQKKIIDKIKPSAMTKGLIERLSKLQATAQLFHHGSLGHCDPCDPSKHGDQFWLMTHDPLKHFHLCRICARGDVQGGPKK